MIFGYARVSTQQQDLGPQRAALFAAGCDEVYEEKISGASKDRPQLDTILVKLRAGDTFIVTRLDRLGRSTLELLTTVKQIGERGVGFRSLAEPWADTTSPAGIMIMTVFAGIADFERSLILGRTDEGRATAKARGQRFGRPPAISDEDWRFHAPLIEEGRKSVAEVAATLRVSRATVHRRYARHQADKLP